MQITCNIVVDIWDFWVQYDCSLIGVPIMNVAFDTDTLRDFLREDGISIKQLRDRYGFTRAETDSINLNEEFLELPLDTIVKVAKVLRVNPIRITGSHAVTDLLANFPLVEEGDFAEAEQDEYHLIALSTAHEIQVAMAETESMNSVGAIEACRQRCTSDDQQLAELAAMQRQPDVLLGSQVGWLASVSADVLLNFEAEIIEFEQGLLAGNLSQRLLSRGVGTIKDLAKRADTSQKASKWRSYLDTANYRIFYLRLARPLHLSVRMDEDTENGYIPSHRYDFILKPFVYRDLFVIAEPKTEYVLVRAKRFSSRTHRFRHWEDPCMDEDVFVKHGVNLRGET